MGLFDRAKAGPERPPTVEELRERLRELRRLGSVDEAWRLVAGEAGRRPAEVELGRLVWEVAVTCDRAEEAAPAFLRAIQQELRSGQNEAGVFHYFELMDRLGADYPLDVDTRLRLAEAMRAHGEQDEEAAELLSKTHEQIDAASPLALRWRAARIAAQVRSKSAGILCPAVLAEPALPEAQRRELEQAWATAQQQGLRMAKVDVRYGAPIELSANVATVRRLQVISAVPYDLDGEKIGLDLAGQGRRRMSLAAVQALATARIDDGRQPPYVVVDLLLDSLWVDKEFLRTVRLRTLDFDPRTLIADVADPQMALITLINNLLAISQAQPLPDGEAACGRPFRAFAALRDYESAILGTVA